MIIWQHTTYKPSKLHQADLVSCLWSEFIRQPEHTGLQVSTWFVPHKHTHKQTVSTHYTISPASWARHSRLVA